MKTSKASMDGSDNSHFEDLSTKEGCIKAAKYSFKVFSSILRIGNYEKLETKEGCIKAAKYSFKTFNSILRMGNIQHKGVSITRELFPEEYGPNPLKESSLLKDCKLYANRETGERIHLKHGGKILEIGIASGAHASSLIQNLNPSIFDGVDINMKLLQDAHNKVLRNHINRGNKIKLHIKTSEQFLEEQIAQHKKYDLIYIDANHWHSFVKKELELSAKLIDVGGHIVLNDYQLWFIGSMQPCGVIKATNNFLCNNKNWKVEYFAINDRDICLKKVSS